MKYSSLEYIVISYIRRNDGNSSHNSNIGNNDPYTTLNIKIFQFGIDCLILYNAMMAKVVTAATFALQQIHSLF